MKKILFAFLFLLCAMTTQAQDQDQTTFILLDETQTPYRVAGKVVAEIKSTEGFSKIFLKHFEKAKTFKMTKVDFDTKGELTGIVVTNMPTAVMRFQTDGYGSRVEMEENDYLGAGQFAKLTLLCQGQESCFTQEVVNIWNPTESTKRNVGYEIYYFAKKEVAENILKEFVAKK